MTVAGRDGRAGMAAIVCRRIMSILPRCMRISRPNLPDYARPVFLRIRVEIDVTGTFKQNKVDLVQRGLRSGRDPRSDLFQRSADEDASCGSIRRLSRSIERGEVRL